LEGKEMRIHRAALVLGALFLAGTALALAVAGSVVLFDPHSEVASATLVDGWGHRQQLTSVGIGYIGIPKVEGTVEITCANRKVIRSGYVTPGAPMWQRMGRKGDCSTR
jgi:hypothetical protein